MLPKSGANPSQKALGGSRKASKARLATERKEDKKSFLADRDDFDTFGKEEGPIGQKQGPHGASE